MPRARLALKRAAVAVPARTELLRRDRSALLRLGLDAPDRRPGVGLCHGSPAAGRAMTGTAVTNLRAIGVPGVAGTLHDDLTARPQRRANARPDANVAGQRFDRRRPALRRSALRAVCRETAVTVESAWCSAFAVRVDGSWRSAATAKRCTSARVSGTAMASNSHILRRLEKKTHMLKVPSSSPRGSRRYPPCPGLSTPERAAAYSHVVTRWSAARPIATSPSN